MGSMVEEDSEEAGDCKERSKRSTCKGIFDVGQGVKPDRATELRGTKGRRSGRSKYDEDACSMTPNHTASSHVASIAPRGRLSSVSLGKPSDPRPRGMEPWVIKGSSTVNTTEWTTILVFSYQPTH